MITINRNNPKKSKNIAAASNPHFIGIACLLNPSMRYPECVQQSYMCQQLDQSMGEREGEESEQRERE